MNFFVLEKYHLNYHDVHTLHYLSQGYPPKETQQQLQNHFEAWKVLYSTCSMELLYAPVWLGGAL